MGSWTDLKQEQMAEYTKLRELYQAGKTHVSMLEQSIMIDLYKQHGYDVMYATIEACCLNGWTKVDKVRQLAPMMEKFGVVKAKWAIERMNGLENHSLDTVRGILDGSIPAFRKKPGVTEPARAKRMEYPTPDGVHTEATAARWMHKQGVPPSTDAWKEYFDLCGEDQVYHCKLYKLKAEYR